MNTDTRGPEYATGDELLADLVVIRHSDDIPLELRTMGLVEGKWWNLASVHLTHIRCPLADGSIAVATPSGRFEVDGTGRVAEVWELTRVEYR